MSSYSAKCVSSQEYPSYYCQSAVSTLKYRVIVLWTVEEAAPMETPWPAGARLRVIPAACWRSIKEWLRSCWVFPLAASSAVVSGPSPGCLLLPSRWELQGTSKVNDHLPGCPELLGDARWGASGAFWSSFWDAFWSKVAIYFHAPVFSISLFQPLIMICVGTKLAAKD